MPTKPKVLIVGAGIGGLTTAIALRQAGLQVEVFERAADLKEIGAGIGLSPNAMRVLGHLGLLQEVVDRGSVIKSVLSTTSRGSLLSNMPANLADVPAVCIHRAELQQTHLSVLPSACVHLREQFVSLDMTIY